VGWPSKAAAASATLPTIRRRSRTPTSPTAGPRRSHSLTDRTHLHPLPPVSSKLSVLIDEGKGREQGHAIGVGEILPVPATTLHAKPPSRPHMPTTHMLPHPRSARVRDLTMAAREHALGAYNPDTTNRLWNTILASAIRITPLLLALAPAKVASRPSMPSECHRTVRLAMGEHGV
jgi:hypothetical protein